MSRTRTWRDRLVGAIPDALRDDVSTFDRRVSTRTRKTWAVDAAVTIAVVVFAILMHIDGDTERYIDSPSMVVADLIGVPIAVVVLFWRRRWPLQVAAALAVLAPLAPGVGLAAIVAAHAAGAYGRPREARIGIALLLVGLPLSTLVWPQAAGPGADALSPVIFVLAAGAWGLFAGARRELLATLEERATRAESEQALRVDQARGQERTRIAREMHDVLAHRMSLLSVHAGALEYRPDAPPEQIARAAGVIRATAHEALEELRAVIGVMRVGDSLVPGDEDSAAPVPEAPQPTLTAVPHLVAQWREAGARIELELDQSAVAALPPTVGRTAYRVVQEALTNAGKHAPSAKVGVVIEGEPGGSLVVAVSNPLPAGGLLDARESIPGTGMGLIGLRERVELVHGVFAAAPDEDLGRFVLEARLPWEVVS